MIFAVFDVLLAVNMCINYSLFYIYYYYYYYYYYYCIALYCTHQLSGCQHLIKHMMMMIIMMVHYQ